MEVYNSFFFTTCSSASLQHVYACYNNIIILACDLLAGGVNASACIARLAHVPDPIDSLYCGVACMTERMTIIHTPFASCCSTATGI